MRFRFPVALIWSRIDGSAADRATGFFGFIVLFGLGRVAGLALGLANFRVLANLPTQRAAEILCIFFESSRFWLLGSRSATMHLTLRGWFFSLRVQVRSDEMRRRPKGRNRQNIDFSIFFTSFSWERRSSRQPEDRRRRLRRASPERRRKTLIG